MTGAELSSGCTGRVSVLQVAVANFFWQFFLLSSNGLVVGCYR
jgi:hypothetical protein